jgi:hypothetical protein
MDKKKKPAKKSFWGHLTAPKMTGAGPRRDKKLLEAEQKALGIKPKKGK